MAKKKVKKLIPVLYRTIKPFIISGEYVDLWTEIKNEKISPILKALDNARTTDIMKYQKQFHLLPHHCPLLIQKLTSARYKPLLGVLVSLNDFNILESLEQPDYYIPYINSQEMAEKLFSIAKLSNAKIDAICSSLVNGEFEIKLIKGYIFFLLESNQYTDSILAKRIVTEANNKIFLRSISEELFDGTVLLGAILRHGQLKQFKTFLESSLAGTIKYIALNIAISYLSSESTLEWRLQAFDLLIQHKFYNTNNIHDLLRHSSSWGDYTIFIMAYNCLSNEKTLPCVLQHAVYGGETAIVSILLSDPRVNPKTEHNSLHNLYSTAILRERNRLEMIKLLAQDDRIFVGHAVSDALHIKDKKERKQIIDILSEKTEESSL